MIDVEAGCGHATQGGGDGEEGHGQSVVTAYITCCHQENCRADHACRKNTVTVKTSSKVADTVCKISRSNACSLLCDVAIPYQQQRRTF